MLGEEGGGAAVGEAGTLLVAATAALRGEAMVEPLISATTVTSHGTLATAGDRSQQLTRVLRQALHAVLARLQFAQLSLIADMMTGIYLQKMN